jgi:hypothetical protein
VPQKGGECTLIIVGEGIDSAANATKNASRSLPFRFVVDVDVRNAQKLLAEQRNDRQR